MKAEHFSPVVHQMAVFFPTKIRFFQHIMPSLNNNNFSVIECIVWATVCDFFPHLDVFFFDGLEEKYIVPYLKGPWWTVASVLWF